ncbi:hypothetical protein [Enterobacter cancerogenus]|uniref:hypothetical protein n=1 Tax=Enterobacter cancerogenus TaxID=69218 RepID=UPI001D0E4407|nr:hypothetical protein [Enterobacter cancerogenus]
MSNIDKQALIAKIKKQTESFDTVTLRADEANALLDELAEKDADLQEFQKAASQPIGWTDEQELRSVHKDGCGYLFKATPVSPHADPRRVIMLYTAPPVQIVHGLCTAIEALLDMQVRMVKQTNVGASFFDGETISAMNYAPIQARQALKLAKQHK